MTTAVPEQLRRPDADGVGSVRGACVAKALLGVGLGRLEVAVELRPEAAPSGGDAAEQRLPELIRERVEPGLLAASLAELSGFEQVVEPPMRGLGGELAVPGGERTQLVREREALVEVADVEHGHVPGEQRPGEHSVVAELARDRQRLSRRLQRALVLVREREVMAEAGEEKRAQAQVRGPDGVGEQLPVSGADVGRFPEALAETERSTRELRGLAPAGGAVGGGEEALPRFVVTDAPLDAPERQQDLAAGASSSPDSASARRKWPAASS